MLTFILDLLGSCRVSRHRTGYLNYMLSKTVIFVRQQILPCRTHSTSTKPLPTCLPTGNRLYMSLSEIILNVYVGIVDLCLGGVANFFPTIGWVKLRSAAFLQSRKQWRIKTCVHRQGSPLYKCVAALYYAV